MKTFSCTILSQCPEYALERAITMPGWSHASGDGWQPIQVTWYPFREFNRKIYFKAKHRSHAARQLTQAGLHARDLDGGQ